MDYTEMSVPALKLEVTRRGIGGAWTQRASKDDIIAALQSGARPIGADDVPRPAAFKAHREPIGADAGAQLAALIQSLAGGGAVNADAVKAIVADATEPLVATLRSTESGTSGRLTTMTPRSRWALTPTTRRKRRPAS